MRCPPFRARRVPRLSYLSPVQGGSHAQPIRHERGRAVHRQPARRGEAARFLADSLARGHLRERLLRLSHAHLRVPLHHHERLLARAPRRGAQPDPRPGHRGPQLVLGLCEPQGAHGLRLGQACRPLHRLHRLARDGRLQGHRLRRPRGLDRRPRRAGVWPQAGRRARPDLRPRLLAGRLRALREVRGPAPQQQDARARRVRHRVQRGHHPQHAPQRAVHAPGRA